MDQSNQSFKPPSPAGKTAFEPGRWITAFKGWDKWLFGLGILYLGAVGAWLVSQSRPQQPSAIAGVSNLSAPTDPATSPASPNDDQAFIAYLRQSLATLDSASSASVPPATVTVNAPPPPMTPLPPAPPPVAANTAPNPSPNTTVVERYYYPVYPSPTPPPVSAQAPPAPVAIAPPAPMVPTTTRHDLVGVLEAGDQSSALFRWNGTTQKIQIGEAIGSSGWLLTSITGQKAILSKQGKMRYVEVGQGF